MHPGRFRVLLPAALIIAGSVFSVGQTTQQSSPVDISFTVSMTKPHTHLLEVDARVKREANAPAPTEELLVMPVWTPGSYLVREYARHVQDFSAKDATGQPLKWEKIQ